MRRRGVGRGVARGPARMAARRMTRRRVARMRRRRRRRRIILVGGMVALGSAAVYKLSKKDVEKVEQYTGKPAEELSDEELNQAMTQLNIPKEEVSDDEYDYIEQEDAKDDAAGGDDDPLDQIERLAELNKAGIITDEEFAAKKAQLLGL
ncbi:MAG: SHOCT domain-containing protein [Anaerolineales bacterium]|nr:SHOCT domain-containing protein [Anaerolineales bacterium]